VQAATLCRGRLHQLCVRKVGVCKPLLPRRQRQAGEDPAGLQRSGRRDQARDSTKESTKPATVLSATAGPPCSKASGIRVSAREAMTAPAANASGREMVSGSVPGRYFPAPRPASRLQAAPFRRHPGWTSTRGPSLGRPHRCSASRCRGIHLPALIWPLVAPTGQASRSAQ
jgi:hypothetical protein